MPSPLLAVAATFTAEPLRDTLEFWARELGWSDAVEFAPYGQVFQALLDPTSLFAVNRGGANLLLVRMQDWPEESRADSIARLVSAVESHRASSVTPLVVALCPSPEPLREEESSLAEALTATPGVHVLTPDQLLDLYPVAQPHDLLADRLGHVPYSPLLFAALGTLLARTVHALRRPPFKVAVLDCDNTLWQGTTGEDGPENVRLDPPQRFLQQFMARQRDGGMLLALCSKNNEADVWETFRLHPEMPLQPQHLTAWRINWEPKGPNLTSLARELSLGLDSFVFLDDDAKECGEVQASCPAVVTLSLPHDAATLPHYLRHVWAFDRTTTTDEDRRRAASYAHLAERGRLERQATSLEEFLRELRLEVHIAPMRTDQLPRVAQLTQRTNQMNATTKRRSEAEIQALLRAGELECLTVEVSDRFGSYGLVGVVLFGNRPDAVRVDTFLLSCRALGRGVEHRMLAHLGRIAVERGFATLQVPFAPTMKNHPARTFLEGIGTAENGVYCFAAGDLGKLQYHPVQPSPTMEPVATATAPTAPGADYARIARELSRPEDVLAQVGSQRRRSSLPAAEPPQGDVEQRLADLWADVLALPAVGRNEDFFDLGGHSLLAVQLLSRVRQAMDVELSLDVVYAGTLTVAGMAEAIELQSLSALDPAEAEALLRELEGLSDEEVQRMLAEDSR